MDTPTLGDLRGGYQEIYDQAFRYAEERLYPLFPRMDDEDWYPAHLIPELGAAGYLGITAPPELGGAGLDLFASGMVAEAFSYWNPNASSIWGPHENLCLNNLLRNGNAEQKARWIPPLCRGEIVGALGLTEPEAGSDALGAMRTTARRDGEDYVLNGRKMFISNGPVADLLLVYAKTAPERGPHGISAFLVEKDRPGFGVAQSLKKMGWRGCPTGELVFDDCRVPAANLVGAEHGGVAVVMSGLDIERAFFALPILGSAERCLHLALDYAGTRRQFNRPIGDFQFVQGMLADMYTEIEAARSLAYRALVACNALEQGGGGRGDLHKLCAASLLKAGQVHVQCTDMALQIHGGTGFMWEAEVNRHYRNAKLSEIGAGTREVRRIIIATELLKQR
ncbi:MAG: acyl-CoA dehydrogenase family protein [Gammaproteobacteria bacterium]|nr:acyl-CoA dehydrogenase family protein [Gammaproteobacteria bacterium]